MRRKRVEKEGEDRLSREEGVQFILCFEKHHWNDLDLLNLLFGRMKEEEEIDSSCLLDKASWSIQEELSCRSNFIFFLHPNRSQHQQRILFYRELILSRYVSVYRHIPLSILPLRFTNVCLFLETYRNSVSISIPPTAQPLRSLATLKVFTIVDGGEVVKPCSNPSFRRVSFKQRWYSGA